MGKRFVAIWFRYLRTDWLTRRRPDLRNSPFVLTSPVQGRKVISAVNPHANDAGIETGITLADARALYSPFEYFDDKPELNSRLLKGLAEWCIRYTPFVAIHPPDCLILDATGCAHLWDGEDQYLLNIYEKLKKLGYQVRLAMADTVGTAWAFSHYGENLAIIKSGQHQTAIQSLPPAALRLNEEINLLLQKLGLRCIRDLIQMPKTALKRRFDPLLLKRLNQSIGNEEEVLIPVVPVEPYQVRLPSLEPIVTRCGIETALQQLLATLCKQLNAQEHGLRTCLFTCFRVDGKRIQLEIGTNRASSNQLHLFKLFELKLDSIEPDLGIELFMLEAKKVEPVSSVQQKIWEKNSGLDNSGLVELLDRFCEKFGRQNIHRFLPAEHYWPERSYRVASSLTEQKTSEWRKASPRPVNILPVPISIDVTAPIPDYPPMLFRYKGKLHKVVKADGPERIEQEWWLQQGEHRDYYIVEDEGGQRYWIFRSGHYDAEGFQGWFIHGFFA